MTPWRIALAYIAFSVLALALFAMPLWHGWRVSVGTLRVFVPEEMQALPELFHREGAAAVTAAVRSRSDPTHREVVVFAGPGKEVLAGTLRRWPAEIPDASGTYGQVIDLGGGSSMRIVVSRVSLPGDYHLLMGRESAGLMSMEGRFWYGMAAAMTIVLGLGAALAWLLARRASAARHSEERYARALQASKDGIWEWNPATDEIFLSDRALRLWAVPDGVEVRTRAEVKRVAGFHPEDFQRTEDVVAANVGAHGFDMEYRVIGPTGDVRWVRSQGKAFPGADGRPVLMTGSLTDITERKLADLALAESEARFRSLTELSNDFFWETDAEHRYTAIELGRAYTGVRNNASKLGLARWEIAYASPDEAAWAAHRAAIAARERFVDFGFSRIEEGEERFYEHSGEPRYDAQDNFLGYRGVGRDVTARKRAEQALRESEKRYERAMLASNAGLWEWDVLKDEYYISPRHLELLGFAPDTTFSGREDFMRRVPFHPEDRERWRQAQKQVFASGGSTLVMDLRVIGNGETRWVRVNALCFRDAEGRVLRWTGSVTDVNEAKRAEEALRESEQRYARAMDGSDAGQWEWNLITNDLFLSERGRQLLALPAGELPAKLAEVTALVPMHPEDRARMDARLSSSIAGGLHEREYRVMLPSGTLRWIRSVGKVFHDASGTAVRMTGSLVDITERKLAEGELRASEERYSLAMEASEEGHFDVNLDTDEHFISERLNEIHGFRPGTRTAKRSEFIKHIPFYGDDAEKFYAAIAAAEAKDGPERYECEFRIVRPSGEVRWLRTRGKVTRDAQGRACRRTGVVADVTEARVAEQALRESQERYALAVAGSDDGIWDVDFAARRVFVSARARELAGLPPGPEMVPMEEYFAGLPLHPDDVPRRIAAMQAHMTGQAPAYDGEFRLRQPDGVYRWRRLHALCVRDANGKPYRMAGSISDIDARRRAEESLRLSEERYALAMEVAEEGHLDWNVKTDEFFASAQARRVLNVPQDAAHRTRADVMGRVPYHPDDGPRVSAAWRASLAGREAEHEIDYRILRGEEPRWIRGRWKIFRNADGAPQRVIGVVSDITERRQALDTLRESESRFRTLVELNSGGFWEQDENLRYTPSVFPQDITGYSCDDRVGKTRWELCGNLTPLSGSWLEHQADLAARRPFRDFEYRRLRPDGEMGYYSASGAPIFDDQGRFKGYYGVASDITERKRFEEELRSRQEMLDLAQKSARVTAFEWKIGAGEGQNRWSPDLEAMYGFPPGTYDGAFETWTKRVHPEDWPALKEAIRHAQRTGDIAADYRVVHRDGSVHWLQAKGRMFFDPAGKPGRIVGFMQDITQRKQAEEELRKMEQELRRAQRLEAMGTLAGGIAHDFNNILGAILGYGEMASRDAPKASRLARDLDSIIVAGERGRALVDRVLAFSRSAMGERVPVHVEKVVREALDMLSAKLPASVTLHAKLRAGRAALVGDATQVHQVMTNLATNAIQAMPAGGTLRVSLDAMRVEAARGTTIGALAAGEYLVLAVSDTGTGIAPEIVDRIFDPFFTTKEVGTGTGLGLSLVHGIVTALGGAIDVASKAGAGSTFTVYLPRSGEAPEAEDEAQVALPRGEGQRVLIVDDEELLVDLATRTLEELGYAPVGFTSSAAALAAFRADPQRFDAVITDERMPGMSGSALIREVRGIRERIPIVLMSGYVGAGVSSRARAAGAEEVLKKPLSAHDLAASLARVLQHVS